MFKKKVFLFHYLLKCCISPKVEFRPVEFRQILGGLLIFVIKYHHINYSRHIANIWLFKNCRKKPQKYVTIRSTPHVRLRV